VEDEEAVSGVLMEAELRSDSVIDWLAFMI
jgi:hypothetical protein